MLRLRRKEYNQWVARSELRERPIDEGNDHFNPEQNGTLPLT